MMKQTSVGAKAGEGLLGLLLLVPLTISLPLSCKSSSGWPAADRPGASDAASADGRADGGSQPRGPAYTAATWVQLGGPPGGLGYDIRYDLSDFNRWYVTDGVAGFFFSDDRGLTWKASNQGLQPLETSRGSFSTPDFCVTVDQHNPSTVWTGLQYSGHVYKSIDRAGTWVASENGIVPNAGQSFRGFTIHPTSSEIVYATSEVEAHVLVQEGKKPVGTSGVGGRVYRTTDGGKNWSAIWEGDALARYTWIAPDDPQRIYVSTGFFDRMPLNLPPNPTPDNMGGVGILRTTDGGKSWTTLGKQQGLRHLYVGSLFMKPGDSRTLLAGAGSIMTVPFRVEGTEEVPWGGAYLTTDGGDSWQEVIAREHITAVEFCQQNPSIAYAGSRQAVFRSSDGGRTWARYGDHARHTWGPAGLAPGVPVDLQTDPESCDRVFINNYVGGNFLSEDGGKTWRVASQGYTGADPPRVFVDPNDDAHVWTVTRMAPWESEDGGLTWAPKAFPAIINGGETMGMDPSDASHLLIDSTTSIVETRDRGQSWSVRHPLHCPPELGEIGCLGVQHRHFAFAPSDPRIIYAGTFNTAVVADDLEDKRVRGLGMVKSSDGGQTWTALADSKIAHLGFSGIAVHPSDPKTVYAAASLRSGVFKSSDGGQSWNSVNQGLPQPLGVFWTLAIDPSDANRILGGGSQGMFESKDAAVSWQQVAAGIEANAQVRAIVFHQADPKVVYASTSAGVVCSTNGGQSFRPLNQGLGDKNLASSFLALSKDGSVLYASSIGIFRLGTPAGAGRP